MPFVKKDPTDKPQKDAYGNHFMGPLSIEETRELIKRAKPMSVPAHQPERYESGYTEKLMNGELTVEEVLKELEPDGGLS